ncbi:late competence development ComFB family protein [Herbivorax sp. ANBcel31]|uniref:late competence development ComFB family protein n=1 Tax=Herbivorax sp. ANBcel31 TaxID=3069754 RepID=UPI0027B09C51|nr:late competence development ComFB family protein [Herbivorax sp. ANBcel31]MDQ2087886.1 late competence development ComFB family protein [Herbivorax sp. ANBcel31]
MSELKDSLYTHAGLENLTENIVLKELEEFIKDTENMQKNGYCKCWICLADVAAIVLNELKPNYCSNFMDKNVNNEYFTNLRTRVGKMIERAFKIVKKNPHHKG